MGDRYIIRQPTRFKETVGGVIVAVIFLASATGFLLGVYDLVGYLIG